jgi:hypothetical protein
MSAEWIKSSTNAARQIAGKGMANEAQLGERWELVFLSPLTRPIHAHLPIAMLSEGSGPGVTEVGSIGLYVPFLCCNDVYAKYNATSN